MVSLLMSELKVGVFALGLLAAWLMTFLDTVDGKLARVSLQSSKLGHWMDHGLDIIHPPIWYWCWAQGLGQDELNVFGQMIFDKLLVRTRRYDVAANNNIINLCQKNK